MEVDGNVLFSPTGSDDQRGELPSRRVRRLMMDGEHIFGEGWGGELVRC